MNDYVGREVMEHDGRRAAFNALAKKTFGLSFEAWYRDGYWTEKYMPYTLFDGARAVSNVSVNRLDVVYEGNTYLMYQLGTVMTDPEYRGQGYAARLIRRIQEEYLESCDTMFLFANKNVLDFYPKFGFERRIQYGFRLNCRNKAGRRDGSWIWISPLTDSFCKSFMKRETRFLSCRWSVILSFSCFTAWGLCVTVSGIFPGRTRL